MKANPIFLSALFLFMGSPSKATTTAVATCYDATVGEEIIDMPESFPNIKGTTTIGPAKAGGFNYSKDFVGKRIRMSNGVVYKLHQLLGEGRTAAVFALDAVWAIRLNTQMDFLPGFVIGQQFCETLGIPTVVIRKVPKGQTMALDMFPSEHVVIKREYPKHFDQNLTKEEAESFNKANALHLYQNWERLDPGAREAAHQEMKEFVKTLAPLETYFDFQPTNIVRTQNGWRFLDPSLAQFEINFATSKSVITPFAVPGKSSNNWLTNESFGIQGEARKKIGELIQEVIQYRRSHPREIEELAARGRALLGLD